MTVRAAGSTREVLDRREIDNEAVVANSQTSRVMSASADRNQDVVFSGKVYAVNDVRHVRAPRDQARLFVDHRVVNLASLIVILIAWLREGSAQAWLEILRWNFSGA